MYTYVYPGNDWLLKVKRSWTQFYWIEVDNLKNDVECFCNIVKIDFAMGQDVNEELDDKSMPDSYLRVWKNGIELGYVSFSL
jgi:hypothetical protein